MLRILALVVHIPLSPTTVSPTKSPAFVKHNWSYCYVDKLNCVPEQVDPVNAELTNDHAHLLGCCKGKVASFIVHGRSSKLSHFQGLQYNAMYTLKCSQQLNSSLLQNICIHRIIQGPAYFCDMWLLE